MISGYVMNMMELCLFLEKRLWIQMEGCFGRDKMNFIKRLWLFLVLKYTICQTVIKYGNYFPEKVYHCPSLKNATEEIFKAEIWCYSEIILAVSECCKCDSNVYCLRVQEKSNCLSSTHDNVVIGSQVWYTSMDEKNLVFNALQKCCNSCYALLWKFV